MVLILPRLNASCVDEGPYGLHDSSHEFVTVASGRTYADHRFCLRCCGATLADPPGVATTTTAKLGLIAALGDIVGGTWEAPPEVGRPILAAALDVVASALGTEARAEDARYSPPGE